MSELIEKIQRRLVAAPDDEATDPALLARLVREEAGVISDVDVLAVLRQLRHDTAGAGRLEPLLTLDGITDVLVNAPDSVWIDRGRGLERAEVTFTSDDEVRALASRLAGACGARLDDAQPFVDGRLTRDDGTVVRLHAALAPPAVGGTAICLRVLRSNTATLAGLVRGGTLTAEHAHLLRRVIAARRSFLVVGGTGTGKTTMLAALLAEVPATERILCIEDTAELAPDHPHLLTLTTRGANTEGAGAITMSDLLRQALRMRPDRIVVGEIRGAEVVELLAALNTGHDGGAGTVHANRLADVPARLEALAALGGLDPDALHAQLAAAVDMVLVVGRDPTGRRILRQIGVLRRGDDGRVVADAVWDFQHGPTDAYAELQEGLP
ncbi:hypothetical protein B841_01575 [Corynebacterium maris DSM 45190]|uniref:Bacterial type II secretion system protein E domain-containing protein n=1 Tax=Corynebacterium maris DSM 45190 TaxID=1224163 RepID=S5TGJ2_9CORY|nr:TadA family conjugal transfer-associated ATPase [Corynebacterium maris]AGS33798.1 hypothetical protein B841_01575 [Corynebacterium maris DSM 45190]